MNSTRTFVACLVSATLLGACAMTGSSPAPALDAAIAGSNRTAAYAERDGWRHPKQTLAFFGIKPDMTVVEVWPGGGWYSEILAPYLRDSGKYYAAGFAIHENSSDYFRNSAAKYAEKLAANPLVYGKVIVTALGRPDSWTACPPGTADRVLTFRNVHNWMGPGYENEMFTAFYAALKSGGVLGVVEHRAKPGTSMDDMKKSGYVTQAYVVELATKAGFKLQSSSEVNANPKDTADHPEGVWTLPPSLRLGDTDREKYLAIGESDRMTLRFVKP